MDIHIRWNNDAYGFIIPINPEEVMINVTMNNTSLNIHNLGEINLKGKRGLYSITLESFFPSQVYDFARGSYHDPYDYYIYKLKNLFEKNTTIHLVATETKINGYFTIEDFNYGHKDKSDDVYYSISLKEYREIGSTKVATKRVTKEVKTKSIKWKKGDKWQKVTKSVLGSSTTWKTQQKNNKSVISKAKKKYPKKKENDALIGYTVVIKK